MHKLPLNIDLNTIETILLSSEANYRIGLLQGVFRQLDKKTIILNALAMREAKDSCVIDGIIVRFEEIYCEMARNGQFLPAAQVLACQETIISSYQWSRDCDLLRYDDILKIHSSLSNQKEGLRDLADTVARDSRTNEFIFQPPQSREEISYLLHNFENYFNDSNTDDPLITLALLYFQFASIYPFSNANGRTARILSSFYLTTSGKLTYPILNLSRYIIKNQEEYYRLFQACHTDINNIHAFIQFILRGIIESSCLTICLIDKINHLVDKVSDEIEEKLGQLYSQKLVDFLFSSFQITISMYRDHFGVTRQTASRHLKLLEDIGILLADKHANEIFYRNSSLLIAIKN